MLSNDTDKSIRKDLSHQLRYLLNDMSGGIIQQHFIKIIDNYITDNDIIIRTEIILAVAGNCHKFTNEYINNEFKTYCISYFNMDNSNLLEYFQEVKTVFIAMLGVCEKSYKPFIEVIKSYLKKFFMITGSGNDFISSNLPFDYIIESSDIIIRVMDEGFVTDYVLYIICNVISKEGISFILTYEQFNEVDYKLLFYKNIHKFLTSASKDISNKFLVKCYFEPFEQSSGMMGLIKLSLKNLNEIITYQSRIKNKEFFNEFIANFEKFEEVVFEYDKCQEWREIRDILIALER
jgi:hypothetical protein